MPTPAEMKKALREAGFEIYRTRGDVVHLAERVRENLLMDSGVFVHSTAPAVGFVLRAQKADFPGEIEGQLFDRARLLAKAALDRGYAEVGTHVRDVQDPGDSTRTLDVWFEVSFVKPASDAGDANDANDAGDASGSKDTNAANDLNGLMDDVRFALALEKAAPPR